MKWIYTAFWVFIGAMLLWQFHEYNRGIDKKIADAGPRQEHFFFTPSSPDAINKPPPKPDAADVKQVGFTTENDKPVPGNFTCHVTLKNMGNMKATAVQVIVMPFHGAIVGSTTGGRGPIRTMDPYDPAYGLSESLVFPDLEPGQSATRDTIFPMKPGVHPGANSDGSISFRSAKPDAPAPQPAAPSTP